MSEELACETCPFNVYRSTGLKSYCIQDVCCEASVDWLKSHDAAIKTSVIEEFFNDLQKAFVYYYDCGKDNSEIAELVKNKMLKEL